MRISSRWFLSFAIVTLVACGPGTPTGSNPDDDTAVTDAGSNTVDPDAGGAEPDAGAQETDAGPDEIDAGAQETDAGPDEIDAGPQESDAGSCDEGYTGDACDECATGYQDVDDDAVCLPSCEAAGDLALACGDHSACTVDDDTGTRACECDPGFELDGDDCVLGSPTTGMWLWLDADDISSVALADGGDFASTKVEKWTDTRAGFLPAYFSADVGANQPTLKTNALNGRRVISFDGSDDFLLGVGGGLAVVGSGPFKDLPAYTIFIVGYASAGAQVFFSASNASNHGLVLQSEGAENFRFLHRTPISNVSQPDEDNLISTGGGYSRTNAQILGAMRTPELQGVSRGVGDAGLEVQASTADPFPSALEMVLGRLSPTGATARYLDGDIAEVLIYRRALTADEVAHTQSYLAAKWGLE